MHHRRDIAEHLADQVSTGVTCPLMRYHPAIVAQAAATAASMMPGRFELGLGTGESLNEHIIGGIFPTSEPVRLDMLREAVNIIRTLWKGGMQDYYGNYYTVDNAQIFELPEELPKIRISAEGPMSAEVAGEIGDALIHYEQKPEEVIETFRASGGEGKSCMVETAVCYGRSVDEAKRTAYEWFPVAANKGELNWIVPTPTHFEQMQQMVTQEDVGKKVLCGPDTQKIIQKVGELVDMGSTVSSFTRWARTRRSSSTSRTTPSCRSLGSSPHGSSPRAGWSPVPATHAESEDRQLPFFTRVAGPARGRTCRTQLPEEYYAEGAKMGLCRTGRTGGNSART